MILTGNEIHRQVTLGHITIEPFEEKLCRPDSYNYRLGPRLKVFRGTDDRHRPVFEEIVIPDEGYVLPKGVMTLGHTAEIIGSDSFAMSLIGRSSVGRLGLFMQVSADLGHTTSCHQWTLEMVPAIAIRVYRGMRIGQVTFWTNEGVVQSYRGHYGRFDLPTESILPALPRQW